MNNCHRVFEVTSYTKKTPDTLHDWQGYLGPTSSRFGFWYNVKIDLCFKAPSTCHHKKWQLLSLCVCSTKVVSVYCIECSGMLQNVLHWLSQRILDFLDCSRLRHFSLIKHNRLFQNVLLIINYCLWEVENNSISPIE